MSGADAEPGDSRDCAAGRLRWFDKRMASGFVGVIGMTNSESGSRLEFYRWFP